MSLLRRVLPLIRSRACAYHNDVITREEQPSRIWHKVFEGERIVDEPPHTLTEVQISTEHYKHVEKLLPMKTVPEPPQHEQYPTPSGWTPQRVRPGDLPYFIKRTRFHNYPIYIKLHSGGNRKMTVICQVLGDIWAFEGELREYLEAETGRRAYTQVDEVCRKVRVRGDSLALVTQFCLSKGL